MVPCSDLWINLESYSRNELRLGGIFRSIDTVNIITLTRIRLAVNVGVVGINYTHVTENANGNVKSLHIKGSTDFENMLPLISSVMKEIFPQFRFAFLIIAASCIQCGVKATTIHGSATIFSTMTHHLILGVEPEYPPPL